MKLKRIVTIATTFVALAAIVGAAPRERSPRMAAKISGPTALDLNAFIDANRVFSYVTNVGSFARDNAGQLNISGGGGMIFPYAGLANVANGQANKSLIFAAGLWMGGEDAATGDTLIAMAEFSEEFTQGPMSGGTFLPDDPAFKVYKIYSDSLATNPNQDYIDYMLDAVLQGAPIGIESIDTTVTPFDTIIGPDLVGSQMLWTIYNDAKASKHTNDAGSTAPLGVEIQQTAFAFKREDPLGNIMFLRYKISNKGSKTINNMFISLWCDPDLGGFTDDLVASDVPLSLGYCYNSSNTDQVYGSNPPAVGFDFFQGPLLFTGDAADTARMFGQLFPMNQNLPLVSFNKYINGEDPTAFDETYFFMNGLTKDGSPLIDPSTGNPTKFFGNGDPVTGTGFIDILPADRRFMLSTGPITFVPGDSTEILAAVVIGQGVDRLTSISAMKFFDKFAQSAYELNFDVPTPPAPPVVVVGALDKEIVLTWSNESEVNNGTYPFQGYSVYQGVTAAGPFNRIATFDIADGNSIIFDDEFDLTTGLVLNKPVQFGSDIGVQRYISIKSDVIVGGRLHNAFDYVYRVEAYTLDPAQTPKTLATSAPVITVSPQGPVAGTDYNNIFGDTMATTHLTGASDGSISPSVLDPSALTGDSYMVVFNDDPTLGTVWSLINTTTNTTLLTDQINQGALGAENYPIAEGILMKVSGPPLEGKSFGYAASSPLNVSPVVVADEPAYAGDNRWLSAASGSDGELLFGGVYLGPNFTGSTLQPAEYKVVEVRFRPMVSYTDLTLDGRYTNGEPYVVDDPAQTQSAFMYAGFANGDYQGFNTIPFTAWDMSNPATPRQLNVVVRDRDANGQWDFHEDLTADPNAALLPNAGDIRFNYVWILDSDYDATGTLYGDGTGGTIGFMTAFDRAMWAMWLGDRGSGRGLLAEESIFTMTPNFVNSPADTFTFASTAPTVALAPSAADLAKINVVPNPYYLFSAYETDQFDRQLRFRNLPTECTIRIFNLSGDLIRTLEKNTAATSILTWDMQNESRLPVASGIYIYLVTTPGGEEKLGKMAIFTESERLTNF